MKPFNMRLQHQIATPGGGQSGGYEDVEEIPSPGEEGGQGGEEEV